VNNPVAKDLNQRVSLYGEDQISILDGAYLVDEDVDGTIDYSFGDPDFAYVQFRSNLVLRWEYIPGSEIFLVWSQGITGLGDVNNSFSKIIFLLKATYRFVL